PRFPPNITLEPEEEIRIKGEAFKITCSANAEELPELRWETPVANYSFNNYTSFDLPHWTSNSTLYIPKVNFTDSGNYTCTGYYPEFEAKQNRRTTSLHVIEEGYVRLTSSSDSRIELKAGESASMKVQIEAYPSQLSWAWVHENLGNQSNVSSQAMVKPDGHY
ncbi:hypothetical protein XELAEV_180200584mg, partial [Xenopus laevis]